MAISFWEKSRVHQLKNGSVTSVGVSTGSSGVPVTGSPVTTSGTIDLGLGTLAAVNDAPSDGNTYGRKDGAWAVSGVTAIPNRGPGCGFYNGGLLISASIADEVSIPYAGTIVGWTITGDATGDASILVSKATYANYDKMTTLFTATLTSDIKATASGLSHAISAGDIVRFSGSGFSGLTRCKIVLDVEV